MKVFTSKKIFLIAASLLLLNIRVCIASDYKSAINDTLDANSIALIVNQSDVLSRRLATYYRQQRSVPIENVIYVDIAIVSASLSIEQFKKVRKVIQANTLDHIKAYAVFWAEPYKVDCMSLSSALSFGFNPDFCADGCEPTRISPLYDSYRSVDFWPKTFRPTMLVAAQSYELGKALIDRGVNSDGSHPKGTAYLLSTTDKNRNVRSDSYPSFIKQHKNKVSAKILKQDYVTDRTDILFYFTGSKRVRFLGENHFLPGAVGDHLTSAGGMLTDSYQMSSLRWLEAGATGSYGAVTEPCNFVGKFPEPEVLAKHYLAGSTLIEAYWKSVKMPGQGIFIGEPLARPFAPVPPTAVAERR